MLSFLPSIWPLCTRLLLTPTWSSLSSDRNTKNHQGEGVNMQISGPDLDPLPENLHLNELGPRACMLIGQG